jgi:transcriptional regulator with XRE-family HTH domain
MDETAAHNVIVGQRLRAMRNARGVSQEKLASELGVTFQQVQKYENGTNGVSVPKLRAIAKVFGVSVVDIIPELAQANRSLEDSISVQIEARAQVLFSKYKADMHKRIGMVINVDRE